jgi:hypothetical protein
LALALQIGFLKMTGRTLNSVELIPPQILDRLGRQVDCVAPRIASIRAFYRRRRRTRFEHHTTHFGCSDAANSSRTQNADWWPIFAERQRPFSTSPSLWHAAGRGWSSINICYSASAHPASRDRRRCRRDRRRRHHDIVGIAGAGQKKPRSPLGIGQGVDFVVRPPRERPMASPYAPLFRRPPSDGL